MKGTNTRGDSDRIQSADSIANGAMSVLGNLGLIDGTLEGPGLIQAYSTLSETGGFDGGAPGLNGAAAGSGFGPGAGRGGTASNDDSGSGSAAYAWSSISTEGWNRCAGPHGSSTT